MGTHKVGGTEIVVEHHLMAGGDVYSLTVRSKSSLDYNSVVLNLTPEEFGELVSFLGEFLKSSGR